MCLFNKSVLMFHIDFVVIEFQNHVVTDLPELESRLKSMDELFIVYDSKTFYSILYVISFLTLLFNNISKIYTFTICNKRLVQ